MNLAKTSAIKLSDLHIIELFCAHILGNRAHARSLGCCYIPLSFIHAMNEYADRWESNIGNSPMEWYFHHSPEEHFAEDEPAVVHEHLMSMLQRPDWPMVLCFLSPLKTKKILGTIPYDNMTHWGQSKGDPTRHFCHIYMDMYGFPRAMIVDSLEVFQCN